MKMRRFKALLFVLLPLCVSGQAIVNGNFETWNNVVNATPAGWFSSNMQSIGATGMASCFQTTSSYSGANAVKLVSIANGNGVIGGYIINANIMRFPFGGGGVPYTDTPKFITGWYRYAPVGGDTGGILVSFNKNGHSLNISPGAFNAATNYTHFSFPILNPDSIPDSIAIYITSSANSLFGGGHGGSTLYIDDLAFSGSGTIAKIPNGNFDSTWVKDSTEEPEGWVEAGAPGSVTKVPGLNGVSAIEMQTMKANMPAAITTGTMGKNMRPQGGRAFTGKTDTLMGEYKLTSVGGDSGTVVVTFIKGGAVIMKIDSALAPAANIAHFKIPFSLPSAPDSMRIDIANTHSSIGIASVGTTLTVDDIELASALLGIKSAQAKATPHAYPNPAKNTIMVYPAAGTHGNISLVVYNTKGEAMVSRNMNEKDYNGGIRLSVDRLAPGMYFYKITCAENTQNGNFVKE